MTNILTLKVAIIIFLTTNVYPLKPSEGFPEREFLTNIVQTTSLSLYGQQSASSIHIHSDQFFDCWCVPAERKNEFCSKGVVPSYGVATRSTIGYTF